tara:strand:+ start:149 stop:604 length:456 start_codon:yes stop_codon:yes gene_type:complete
MQLVSKVLFVAGIGTHIFVLFQSEFELSLAALDVKVGAGAQCSQFRSLMTLAFIFACLVVGLAGYPMVMNKYSGTCNYCQSKWTKRAMELFVLATIYLQAASTFQSQTLGTCGKFENTFLVLMAGLLTLSGFWVYLFEDTYDGVTSSIPIY